MTKTSSEILKSPHWYQGIEQALASIIRVMTRDKHFEGETVEQTVNRFMADAADFSQLTDLQDASLRKKLAVYLEFHAPVVVLTHGLKLRFSNEGSKYSISIVN